MRAWTEITRAKKGDWMPGKVLLEMDSDDHAKTLLEVMRLLSLTGFQLAGSKIPCAGRDDN